MVTARYILKNTSKYDINLGDLRYRIPAGQARDLLSKTARLDWEDIVRSRTNGSIAARLGKTLIEIHNIVEPTVPRKELADPSTIVFPRRVKSSIVLEMEDVSEEIQKISLIEEDEFLKELDDDITAGKVPLVASEEEDDDEKETKTEDSM